MLEQCCLMPGLFVVCSMRSRISVYTIKLYRAISVFFIIIFLRATSSCLCSLLSSLTSFTFDVVKVLVASLCSLLCIWCLSSYNVPSRLVLAICVIYRWFHLLGHKSHPSSLRIHSDCVLSHSNWEGGWEYERRSHPGFHGSLHRAKLNCFRVGLEVPQQGSASHSHCPWLYSGATFSMAQYQVSESSAKNAFPTGSGAAVDASGLVEGGLRRRWVAEPEGRKREKRVGGTDRSRKTWGLSTRKLAFHQAILRSAGRGYCCFHSCCRELWLPGIARSLPELLLQSSVHTNWSGRQKNKTPSAGYVTCGEV